jgi:hypothetical protein
MGIEPPHAPHVPQDEQAPPVEVQASQESAIAIRRMSMIDLFIDYYKSNILVLEFKQDLTEFCIIISSINHINHR